MSKNTVSLLSQIHDKEINWNVCVLVSRLWHYRGASDSGPILHTDLVVIDQEGTHMYAQIPPEVSERLKDVLQEGKVFLIKKFMCNQSKPTFRAVETPYMIQFTRYSTAVLQPDLEDTYPYCTYNLLPFPDIPKQTGNTPRFLDVIGQITAVSDIVPVQSMYQPEPSDTRTIILNDLLGNQIKLLLWGARAREFEAEDVRTASNEGAVVAIFVGTLPKMSQGVKSLSGSSACRWYINEDLPEINAFHTRLGKDVAPLAVYTPIDQGIGASIREAPVEMTVQQLLALDPFDNQRKPFFCKVTITRLDSNQRWWFLSCNACHKTTYINGFVFRCSGHGCPSVQAELAYSICTFATDGSAEAEFMFFEKSSRAAIGKPLLTLLRKKYPGYSDVRDLAQVGGADAAPPVEVTHIVAKTYRLVVAISNKSFKSTSTQLSFQVNRIDQTFQAELGPLEFGPASPSARPSSSTIGSVGVSSNFSPPSSVAPFTPSPKNAHDLEGSNVNELNTPLSLMKGKGQSTRSSVTGKSPCPSNARRKLVLTPPKGIKITHAAGDLPKPSVEAADNKSIAHASIMPINHAIADTTEESGSVSTDDSAMRNNNTNNKRGNAGLKSANNAKKTKQ